MKQTLIAFAIFFSAFTMNAQVSKQDSVRLDSAITKTMIKKWDGIGEYLSDKLTKAQWEMVMNIIDRQLGEAILELRKKIRH